MPPRSGGGSGSESDSFLGLVITAGSSTANGQRLRMCKLTMQGRERVRGAHLGRATSAWCGSARSYVRGSTWELGAAGQCGRLPPEELWRGPRGPAGRDTILAVELPCSRRRPPPATVKPGRAGGSYPCAPAPIMLGIDGMDASQLIAQRWIDGAASTGQRRPASACLPLPTFSRARDGSVHPRRARWGPHRPRIGSVRASKQCNSRLFTHTRAITCSTLTLSADDAIVARPAWKTRKCPLASLCPNRLYASTPPPGGS
eukprot:scaffold2668_cov319-Prasinococcus_capsulatus_cf.AAC.7